MLIRLTVRQSDTGVGGRGLGGEGRGRQAALILGPGLIATIALPLRVSGWGG